MISGCSVPPGRREVRSGSGRALPPALLRTTAAGEAGPPLLGWLWPGHPIIKVQNSRPLGSSYSNLCRIGRPTWGTGSPPRLASAGPGHFPTAGGESHVQPEGHPPPAQLFLACPLASGAGPTSLRCLDGKVPTALSCPTRALSQLTGDRGRRQGRSWQQMQMSGSMQLITGNVQEQIEK